MKTQSTNAKQSHNAKVMSMSELSEQCACNKHQTGGVRGGGSLPESLFVRRDKNGIIKKIIHKGPRLRRNRKPETIHVIKGVSFMEMFAVKDKKADQFFQPIYVIHRAQAVRQFSTAVQKGEGDMHLYPDDFDLYYIGTYDQQTAIHNNVTPELIAQGKAFVNGL